MSGFRATGLIGLLLLYPAVSHAQAEPGAAGRYGDTVNRYCVGCHNDTLKTAGLSLQQVDIERVGTDAAIWEKVLRKLRARAMPPSGMPRPDDATYDGFVSYLETSLNRYAGQHPEPGRPATRRLNRTEYTNAVRDLFALQIDGAALLLPDEADEGFDNVAASLALCSGLPCTASSIPTARVHARCAVMQPPISATYGP